MSLLHILVFITASLAISLLSSQSRRNTLLVCMSVLALYSLQPALSLRGFDFWLPTFALILAWWVWVLTQAVNHWGSRRDRLTYLLLVGLMAIVALSSYLPSEARIFVALPINLLSFALVIVVAVWMSFVLTRVGKGKDAIGYLLIALIVAIFVGLKSEPIATMFSRTIRSTSGQSTNLASALDLNWLGFSYIAFRLIHVLRDHQSSRLPKMGFEAFLLYVFFFPAITAGPIDRVQRFLDDINSDLSTNRWAFWWSGGSRIVRGLLKKFVLADTLALVALGAVDADIVASSGWLWLLLYLYSFRIYFDFSGYTDIAIGLGTLSGISLPENFDQPYWQTDLGAFWNRWHITLAQWFRAYIFNPITRALRQQTASKSAWLIILVGQVVTMGMIGLWHGISWTFLIWGLWHAIGLFVHNRWLAFQRTERGRGTLLSVPNSMRTIISWILTFNYVSLGWVWFLGPDLNTAWTTFVILLGGSLV